MGVLFQVGVNSQISGHRCRPKPSQLILKNTYMMGHLLGTQPGAFFLASILASFSWGKQGLAWVRNERVKDE